MNSLLEEMQQLVDKINEGTASMGEIEAFAAAAQDLNERAIIIRYKAYELKVQPTQVEVQATVEEQVPTNETDFIASKLDESALEMDFDLFSTDEPEETIESDLVLENENSIASSFDFFAANEPASSTNEPVVEQTEITTISEDSAFFDDTENNENFVDFADDETDVAVQTEAEVHEEMIIPATSQQPVALHPIYERLATADDSLAARMLSVRLETLKGAFGFNERMQIVNELLASSNDLYHEIIEQLDNMDSKEEARLFVSSIADKYNWNVSSSIALEFIQKVERRYA
ncbi:MAG: hypothetical protein ACEQR5_07345 [Moraxellaceae bacterium]|jgi:hypothetical protein